MKKLVIFILLISIIMLPGCWDMREITEIGLVMAVGIDRSPGNPGKFLVTVQIADPTGSKGGGGEQEQNKSSKSVWVSSGEGNTIFEAIRDLTKVSSKRIMWAHNNLILIGEDLAREDITAVVDFFTHNHELRMKTAVAITHGNAKDYLVSKIGTGEIPGLAVSKLFRYQKLAAQSYYNELLDIYTDFNREEGNSLISGIKIRKPSIPSGQEKENKEEDQVELSGAAVFGHSKMLGWLTPEETKGLSWVLNGTERTLMSVSMADHNNAVIAVETYSVKAKINSYINGETPSFDISVSGKGSIVEEDSNSNLNINELKSEVENLVNQKIKEEMALGIHKVQKEYRSDVLYLGGLIHIQHEKEWKEKLGKKWNLTFPEVPINIHVNINIISSTLNQEPANYK